ncbi:unnamed protein product [Euphydryas editha]|uniref:Reverse transcriptase domain-containing protein n=1 Tax=Euphydryas editha TaxID=104508 RepID=A0AAU9TT23_EUPED|nr:unnamed protein product [Euphydryas editha]
MPWWNEELAALKREVVTKTRRIRCAAPVRREFVVGEYLEAREKYKIETRNAQTSSWKSFCEKQDGESVWGSIGGPIVWNLLLDPLLRELEAKGVHAQAFADDVVLLFDGETALDFEQPANAALDHVEKWGIATILEHLREKYDINDEVRKSGTALGVNDITLPRIAGIMPAVAVKLFHLKIVKDTVPFLTIPGVKYEDESASDSDAEAFGASSSKISTVTHAICCPFLPSLHPETAKGPSTHSWPHALCCHQAR